MIQLDFRHQQPRVAARRLVLVVLPIGRNAAGDGRRAAADVRPFGERARRLERRQRLETPRRVARQHLERRGPRDRDIALRIIGGALIGVQDRDDLAAHRNRHGDHAFASVRQVERRLRQTAGGVGGRRGAGAQRLADHAGASPRSAPPA